MDKLNDPVFGDLEYNKEGYWTKKIDFTLFGFEDPIDLMVKCSKEEEITDAQRKAYKSYFDSFQKLENEFPAVQLAYYKDHYEEINRIWPVDEELKLENVNEDASLDTFDCRSLYIDRNGNYGWLAEFIWDRYPITVVLSGDKIRIYEGWAVIVMNYALVNDEAFGEMVYEKASWKKWVKMDINGKEGVWVPVVADAYPGEAITPEQRKNYLTYLEKKEDFFDELPNALMTYYLENYDYVKDWWGKVPTKYNKKNINMDSLMSLIEFQTIFFNRDGKRFGWLCSCPWDDVHGLSFDFSDDEIEIGWQEKLFR